jgi:hypothetical protein
MKRLLVLCVLALPAFAQEKPIHLFHASATVIGTEGLVVLPESGGAVEKTLRDYDDGTVRFREATSSVRGEMDGEVAVTTSSIVVKDLDIMNGLVRADRLTVCTTARQRLDEAEARISFAGSALTNLTVRGVPMDAEVDTERFDRHPTFASARQTPIARSIVPEWIIPIDGAGTLYLGRVVVKPGERELAMIRFVPSNGKGVVTIGRSSTNGEPMP